MALNDRDLAKENGALRELVDLQDAKIVLLELELAKYRAPSGHTQTVVWKLVERYIVKLGDIEHAHEVLVYADGTRTVIHRASRGEGVGMTGVTTVVTE